MYSDAQIARVSRDDLPRAALMRAVQAAGSMRRLARALLARDGGKRERKGISHQSIAGWLRRGRCPSTRVIEVEKVTGVSRNLLRPDIYPRGTAAAAPAGEGTRV